jgi:type IV pilus assembly protein PilM
MLELFKPVKSIGLELYTDSLQGAEVEQKNGKALITQLFGCRLDALSANVKRFYIGHPFLSTALDGHDVLIRSLTLPLTKEKDIDSALAFQAEPILPYSVDEALLARQTLQKNEETTDLTLLATRKKLLESHLEQWQALEIEPETVGCVQSALCQFAKSYLEQDKAYLLFHMQERSSTCVLVNDGKLISSLSQSDGLHLLYHAYAADAEGKKDFPYFDQIDFSMLNQKEMPRLSEAVNRLQKMVAMMGLALVKDLYGKPCEGVIVTGEIATLKGLEKPLAALLKQPIVHCIPQDNYSAHEMQCHAVSLGLAIGSLPQETLQFNFRQQELSYPKPWLRLAKPMAIYFAVMIGLSAAFYLFGQTYIAKEEDQIKQSYVNLLSNMNKSYDQFERSYLTKNPGEKKEGDLTPIGQLSRDELQNRLHFLQKDLLAAPDSFPLFANIPRVSDLLAWLNQHPAVIEKNADGSTQTRIQLDDLSYTLVKRPMQGKKADKYQVKVEMEFSSPTPKWAREFHDALIAPNDWVDGKSEVKWSSNRGKYKTSFFLKDKTFYPGQ